jgi:hypothetical protein
VNPTGERTLIHKNPLVKMARKKIQIFFHKNLRAAKSLIFRGLPNCITGRQFIEDRMAPAFSPVKPQLHTKLSTDFVDSEKIPFATVIYAGF